MSRLLPAYCAEGTSVAHDLRNMRVLIAAATDLAVREATEAIAAFRRDWTVGVCLTAGELSAALDEAQWDAVLLDVSLAGIAQTGPLELPFIAWGPSEGAGEVARLLELGAAGHLVRCEGWQSLLAGTLEACTALSPAGHPAVTQWPSPSHHTQSAEMVCTCNAADLADVMRTGLTQTSRILPFTSAVMALQDVESGDVEALSEGLSPEVAKPVATQLLRVLAQEQSEGCVAPVVLSNTADLGGTSELGALRDALESAGLAGLCRVSLTAGDETLGALVFGSQEPIRATPTQLVMLTDLGVDIALGVARVLLSENAARSLQAQQKLLNVALALSAGNSVGDILQQIATTAAEVAGGERASVRLLDEGRLTFHRAHHAVRGAPRAADPDPGPDAADWRAIETGEPVLQTAAGPGEDQVQLTLPMTLDLNAIGTLSVRRRSGTNFRSSEAGALRFLCAQAAVAVHNANLYEIASRRSQHMEVVAAQAWQEEARARALFEIATAVTEKVDLPDILAHVTRSACTEIGFELARIYLVDHEHQMLLGQLQATAGTDPTPITDETIPLRSDCGDPLARAALGTAPYVVDAPDSRTQEGAGYERLLIPLVSQGMLIGLLMAGNPVSRIPVSPQRTRLLHSLAGLAGVAIERARIDQLRGTLISSVSHELRAPLASIRAYNELVMEGDAGEINPEQKSFLERVERACVRLERLIQDLMNLSKLRAGQVSIRKAPCDLSNAIRAVMDTIQPRASQAGVTLSFSEEDSLPPIVTDQGRIEQVLMNLVDNAIKFNDPGGRVELKLRQQDDSAVISVTDDGPGIPPSALTTIFEEFQHGTDEKSRAKDGAGLGLAIARRVVAVLGGKLWVESEPGQGSTFYVSLQLEPAYGVQAAPQRTGGV